MIWGCISGSGVSNLVFIDGILNADGCLSILKENLKQSAKKWAFYTVFIFIKTTIQNSKLAPVGIFIAMLCFLSKIFILNKTIISSEQ